MPYLRERSYGQRSMPIGSSIFMVSVQVHDIKLDLAIITPGSCSRMAMAAYSSHQPAGTEECRNTSRPSRVERQSDVLMGILAAPSTDRGRCLDARLLRTSSTWFGVACSRTRVVNSVRSGVAGNGDTGGALVDMALDPRKAQPTVHPRSAPRYRENLPARVVCHPILQRPRGRNARRFGAGDARCKFLDNR